MRACFFASYDLYCLLRRLCSALKQKQPTVGFLWEVTSDCVINLHRVHLHYDKQRVKCDPTTLSDGSWQTPDICLGVFGATPANCEVIFPFQHVLLSPDWYCLAPGPGVIIMSHDW